MKLAPHVANEFGAKELVCRCETRQQELEYGGAILDDAGYGLPCLGTKDFNCGCVQ